jgi:hypothetical protein
LCSATLIMYIVHTMAEAKISLPDGIVVSVSGTPEEITAVVSRLQSSASAPKTAVPAAGRTRSKASAGRTQLTDLMQQLVESGFFKQPKDLGAVRAGLEEMGHHYPVTTLSPALLRQVRKRNLRRLKQDSRWMYTG